MELIAESLRLTFGKVHALEDVSLCVPASSRLVLSGPAGGGKTSLLKCLAGLVSPSAGQVRWDGREVSALSTKERRAAQVAFGMVFQTDALFDSMSVLENVLLPLRKRGVAEDEAKERAFEALGQVGLKDAALKRPEVLSGGMKKRAGVARAIVARPVVLLADDPFAGLDPVTQGSIASLLLEVSEGRTLIVALPYPVASLPVERQIRVVGGRLEAPG
ncbi:MAG: ATP-binding cassette domain-containing protein [Myxococcota bacterium]